MTELDFAEPYLIKSMQNLLLGKQNNSINDKCKV